MPPVIILWWWAVTPCCSETPDAADRAVRVDEENIYIRNHGHSWGGYQTSFLITQTNIVQRLLLRGTFDEYDLHVTI